VGRASEARAFRLVSDQGGAVTVEPGGGVDGGAAP